MRGAGRALFAAVLLLIAGTLNIIYGIGALDDANIFADDGGSLGAIAALLSIGGAYPWWSLGIFFLCVFIVHGILVYGDDQRAVA